MKEPIKAHLISSDIGLHEGKTYYAVCGAKVENCQWHYLFRDEVREFSLQINPINTCRKCCDAQRLLTGSIVYGIVSARKSPTSERQAEGAVA